MGVQIDGATLERQLAEHGRTKAELAAAADVHPATISHCIAGRPVAARTFRAVIAALHRMEPLPGAEALLAAVPALPVDHLANGRPRTQAAATAPTAVTAHGEGADATAILPV